MTNSYATDGSCHNANHGTFNHECGRPATWLGTKKNGFRSGFCDRCKEEGDERHGFVTWERIDGSPWSVTVKASKSREIATYTETRGYVFTAKDRDAANDIAIERASRVGLYHVLVTHAEVVG